MKIFTVSENVEVILNRKKFLLESGDKIILEDQQNPTFTCFIKSEKVNTFKDHIEKCFSIQEKLFKAGINTNGVQVVLGEDFIAIRIAAELYGVIAPDDEYLEDEEGYFAKMMDETSKTSYRIEKNPNSFGHKFSSSTHELIKMTKMKMEPSDGWVAMEITTKDGEIPRGIFGRLINYDIKEVRNDEIQQPFDESSAAAALHDKLMDYMEDNDFRRMANSVRNYLRRGYKIGPYPELKKILNTKNSNNQRIIVPYKDDEKLKVGYIHEDGKYHWFDV